MSSGYNINGVAHNTGPAPSPLGQIPPNEGMPGGPMGPGFFPVSTFDVNWKLSKKKKKHINSFVLCLKFLVVNYNHSKIDCLLILILKCCFYLYVVLE